MATSDLQPYPSFEPPPPGMDQVRSNEEDSFRALVEAAPALLHSARADGYIDYFNQGWLTFLGAPYEEVCGWKWTQRIHPDDAGVFLAKWRAAIASGEPFESEGRAAPMANIAFYCTVKPRFAMVREESPGGMGPPSTSRTKSERSEAFAWWPIPRPLCSIPAGLTDTWITSTGAGWIIWGFNCKKSRVGIGCRRSIPTMSTNW